MASKPILWVVTKRGCWECVSHVRNGYGYPRVRRNGKLEILARVVYMAQYGSIPKGLEVCHQCDNPACINLDHLFLATHSDNMRDMVWKGRSPFAKLTPIDVSYIRCQYIKGIHQRALARQFGVSQPLISLIVNDIVWR